MIVTVAGLKLHEAPVGNPVHVRATLPVKPFAPATLSGTVALRPEVTVTAGLLPPLCTEKADELGIATRGNGAELLPAAAKTGFG